MSDEEGQSANRSERSVPALRAITPQGVIAATFIDSAEETSLPGSANALFPTERPGEAAKRNAACQNALSSPRVPWISLNPRCDVLTRSSQ